MSVTRDNKESWLEAVWTALEGYRENVIPEGQPDEGYDEEWNDICTAMAWIREELGLEDEIERENRLEGETK